MIRFLYTGSFDPVTHGHLEIIRRAYHLCDELYVGVGFNAEKHYMFTPEERIQLIQDSIRSLEDVRVKLVPGLNVEMAREWDISALVRGVRSGADFDREMQINQINKELACGLDTILFPADDFGFISSSAVKELAKLGATEYELAKFVPGHVARALLKRLTQSPSERFLEQVLGIKTPDQNKKPDGQ